MFPADSYPRVRSPSLRKCWVVQFDFFFLPYASYSKKEAFQNSTKNVPRFSKVHAVKRCMISKLHGLEARHGVFRVVQFDIFFLQVQEYYKFILKITKI